MANYFGKPEGVNAKEKTWVTLYDTIVYGTGVPLSRQKSEIRNSKSETNSNFLI